MTSKNNTSESRRVSDSEVLRDYYAENDFFQSPEGILKVLSVLVCLATSALYLGGAGVCGAAPALAASGATVALAGAAALALLLAGAVLAAPAHAPHAWLFADITVCAVMGLLLVVTAILHFALCDLDGAIVYVLGPLSVVNAVLVTASAALTYAAVTRRWDAARPRREPARAHAAELDV